MGDVAGRNGVHVETLFVALHPREGEEVVDQSTEASILFGDQLEIFFDLLLIVIAAFEKSVYQYTHRRKRGLQLMRYCGDEIILQAIQLDLSTHNPAGHHANDNNHADHQHRCPHVNSTLPLSGVFKDVGILEGEFNVPLAKGFAGQGPTHERWAAVIVNANEHSLLLVYDTTCHNSIVQLLDVSCKETLKTSRLYQSHDRFAI